MRKTKQCERCTSRCPPIPEDATPHLCYRYSATRSVPMKSTSETVDEVISGVEYLEYSEFFPFYSYPGFLLYKSKALSLFSVSMLLSCGTHFPSFTALKPQALLKDSSACPTLKLLYLVIKLTRAKTTRVGETQVYFLGTVGSV